MYKAIDIARYILYIAYTNGDLITNLKLQKLLYYAQAWHLVNNNNRKLFSDDIEAWPHGPLIMEVYNNYNEFGRSPIEEEITKEDINILDADTQKYMNEFLDEFMDFSATSLVNMTHNETPWIEAYKKGKRTIISTDSMYNYYSKL
jgi:uncharacterized phage-associated protein